MGETFKSAPAENPNEVAVNEQALADLQTQQEQELAFADGTRESHKMMQDLEAKAAMPVVEAPSPMTLAEKMKKTEEKTQAIIKARQDAERIAQDKVGKQISVLGGSRAGLGYLDGVDVFYEKLYRLG